MISRRGFARVAAGWGAALGGLRGATGGGLRWEAERAPRVSLVRQYRADAQVLLFGIPLLKRAGVGGWCGGSSTRRVRGCWNSAGTRSRSGLRG